MSMVEKVAKAIWEEINDNDYDGNLPWEGLGEDKRSMPRAAARAAITAMSDPSKDMMFAGADDFFETSTIGLSEYTAEDVWKRMIASALREAPDAK